MTDPSDANAEQKEWYREAEEALERVGSALKGAWEASRDSRVSALESAKKAAQQLGDAIERGVAGAKDHWGGSESEEETEAGGEAETEEE